jgi:hypothetical protein
MIDQNPAKTINSKNISYPSTTYVIFEVRRSDSSLLKKRNNMLLLKISCKTALRIEAKSPQ